MDREVTVTESREQSIELDPTQAMLLGSLGRSLASGKAWWRNSDGSRLGSVIALSRHHGDHWGVTFRNVIGAVRLTGLQIRVVPKIAPTHFAYLLSKSSIAPRLSTEEVRVGAGSELAELLSRWFVGAAELVLRHGLRREYAEAADELSEVRGRIDVMTTSMHVLVGHPVVSCSFAELSDDSPLNRLIKAAASLVAALRWVGKEIRERARRVAERMPSVGPLRPTDLRAAPDRLSRHYKAVVPLAKLVLDSGGISTALGSYRGTAFLIRTPELVEDGLRSALSEALPGEVIRKRSLSLGGSGLSINPDLVFENRSTVGDIKYRKLSRDWDRGQFNQAVTFATGFRSARCAVIGFTDRLADPIPRAVNVGQVMSGLSDGPPILRSIRGPASMPWPLPFAIG